MVSDDLGTETDIADGCSGQAKHPVGCGLDAHVVLLCRRLSFSTRQPAPRTTPRAPRPPTERAHLQQPKLVQAHYDDAVSEDVSAAEQARIAERASASTDLGAGRPGSRHGRQGQPGSRRELQPHSPGRVRVAKRMAEREGFEPSVGCSPHTISSRARSAAPAPLRGRSGYRARAATRQRRGD